MKVYLTRHGETQYSLDHIVCGSTDCPLTKTGEAQALELANALKNSDCDIGIIYTSPLIRAYDTAKIIADVLGVPCIVDTRLREQNCGAYEGAVSRDDAQYNKNRVHFANRLKGGDSTLMLAQRVYNFMDDLPRESDNGSTLIVGHACVCKMVHTYFTEITNEEYYDFKLGTCELREYVI